ncbi:MAG: hypothetical protein ISR65_17770 [Bacteriovoracaceae bacterium]|nr:hypothetical protein [Bacteriovoracaceae bacterium]
MIDQWLSEHIGLENFKGGFDRLIPIFKPVIKKLKNKNVKVVTIAGTNGKGEVANVLAKLIHSKGQSVALWTSPHILSACERFCFNGTLIGPSKLLQYFTSCLKEVEKHNLSYYEFLFYVFCTIANDSTIDVMILEVGLGGRLDAVNLMEPDLTAITSISRDHEEILGRGFKKILLEKLGICRRDVPLIETLELKYCRTLTENFCKDRSISHVSLFDRGIVTSQMDFSTRNRLLSLILFKQLYKQEIAQITVPELTNLMKLKVEWLKGRFEVIVHGARKFVFVGAHNLDGAKKLTELLCNTGGRDLEFCLPFDRMILAFSKRSKKEVKALIKVFNHNHHLTRKLVLTVFDHHKAFDLLECYEELISCDIDEYKKFEFINDWKKYLENTKQSRETILVTGSYYFIAEVQKFLLHDHK